MSECLAHLDLLAGLEGESEVLGRLEDEHDRRAELEAAHLLRLGQGLPTEDGRRVRVHGFGKCSGRRTATTDVCAQLLFMGKKKGD
jgi:hypothetical protein